MISKSMYSGLLLALLAVALLQFSAAQAVVVTGEKLSDYAVEFCFEVATGDTVKDFHFGQGALVDTDSSNITLTGAPGDWSLDIANGYVNAFGSTALTEDATTCITVDISSVGGGKRFADVPAKMFVTADGNNDHTTGIVDTALGVAPVITSDTIPTLSEWGLIIFALLILTLVTVVVTRRRKAVARA